MGIQHAGFGALLGVFAVCLCLQVQPLSAQQKPGVLTGKEKLAGKATDEQRVDNCKVPPPKRGDKARPATCDKKSSSRSAVTE